MLKSSAILLPLALIIGCQAQPAPTTSEGEFQVQALTQPYLTRKVNRWLSTNNSTRLLRELQYASLKHPALMQQVVSQASNPVTLYQQISAVPEVSAQRQQNAPFNTFMNTLKPLPVSCKDAYNRGIHTSGLQTIDPSEFGSAPLQVWCDMQNDGGGWTLVAAQFESDPAPSWNEGHQSDYDPTLATGKGFALSSSELPSDRTQTAFGRDKTATFIDYVNFVYQTGDLSVVSGPGLTGLKAPGGKKYYLHRSIGHYSDHNVGETSFSTTPSEWSHTLSFDQTGVLGKTWAFGPNSTNPAFRGYWLNGAITYTTLDTFAWTVWVR